ncbi:MAG TPA: ribosome maturation factor RimM [Deltaproteobacteria bacterium]|nr:ribosome maturation factor RimM [Deltaproteobacteria bacterium]HQB39674.1 ribosome maturation factor RimM [Deltaproteobacteria bacterium]
MPTDALIPVGKIIDTHGIKGLLKVHSFSGNIESLQAASTITLRAMDGKLQQITMMGVSKHGNKLVIGLKGLEDINQVLPYVGSEICLYRSQLPATGEDEYYWCDLIGLHVATDQGIDLGVIRDIFETGSSDIYIVGDGSREYLIPAIANVIKEVNIAQGRMVVTPLEGMLDL